MADEEIKTTEERKCFGLNEKNVLRFIIPCVTSFIGCLLALAVYASLTGKPPVPPRHCPPPCPRMEAPCPPTHHFTRHHHGEFRPDRPHIRRHHPRPHWDNRRPESPQADRPLPEKPNKK